MPENISAEEWQRLNQRIRDHPGHDASYRWESLRRIHRVLSANERELLALIDRFQQDEVFAVKIMAVGNDGRSSGMDALWDELIRRAHNYLSAVKMLVEHSRNFMRPYAGRHVEAQYGGQVAEVLAKGRGPFLQKLRDYMVHSRIPPFGASMQLVSIPDVPRFLIYLDRDRALEYRDWTAPARKFLREQPEHVPLRELIVGYAADLEQLYEWLYQRFEELHGAEIQELNDLIVQLQGAHNTPGHPDYRPPAPPRPGA